CRTSAVLWQAGGAVGKGIHRTQVPEERIDGRARVDPFRGRGGGDQNRHRPLRPAEQAGADRLELHLGLASGEDMADPVEAHHLAHFAVGGDAFSLARGRRWSVGGPGPGAARTGRALAVGDELLALLLAGEDCDGQVGLLAPRVTVTADSE